VRLIAGSWRQDHRPPPLRSGRDGEAVLRFDANDCRHDRLLELEVAVAEEGLDRFGVEAAGDLLGRGHGELVAGDIRKTARLEFVLKSGEFGLGALHDGVAAADRIGESFVAEIVEARNGGSFEGSHRRKVLLLTESVNGYRKAPKIDDFQRKSFAVNGIMYSTENGAVLSAAQSRAARGLLDWSQAELATRSNLSESTIRDFEKGRRIPGVNNLAAIRAALEAAGVEFTNGGQPGVRMSKSVSPVEFEVSVGDDREPILKGHDGNNVPVIAALSRASFEAFPIQAERVAVARRSRSALNEIANKKYLAGEFQVIVTTAGTYRKVEINASDVEFKP
jgi:transcriptional regulator with XRE-family HTH domain